MNRFLSSRAVLAAAVAIGTLAAAGAAQARTDVVVSIGAPVRYVQPAPVYVQPQPFYEQAQHRRYDEPRYRRHDEAQYRRYERRGAWGDRDRDGVPNLYDRDSRYYNVHAARRAGPWGDFDRDGVPNRYDRAPRNPYRR